MIKRGRIGYIDVARAIAMFAIILGHVVPPERYSIAHICFTFHVPLFFIVSGLLSHKYDWDTLIKKRFRSLIIPYLITSLIIILMVFVVRHSFLRIPGFADRSVASWIMSAWFGSGSLTVFGIKPIGAIWFLLAMFFGLLFLNLIIDKKGRFIYATAVMLIAYAVAPHFWAPLSLLSATAATFFMLIGVKMKEIGIEKIIRWPIVLASFMIWLAVLIVTIDSPKLFSIVELSFTNLPLDIIAAIAGTIVVFGISAFLDKYLKKLANFIKPFGEYSLIALCTHLIALGLIPWYNLFRFVGLAPKWYFALIGHVFWCVCWILIIRFFKFRKQYKKELAATHTACEKAKK
ncbi:acyltransferase [Candidatus Saccharibacteria bacterium]|nr:acyltransferase [Candidatus Saccharibacteria bacterium]